MNASILLRTSAALLTVAACASAMAGSPGTPGYDLYDRVAQNRSHVAAAPAADETPRVAPGGYARHLIYLGVDARQAIKLARSVGEQPMTDVAVPQQREAAGYDLYARIAASNSALSVGSSNTAVR